MKKNSLLLSLALLAFVGCQSDDNTIGVNSVTVAPSSFELFADETLPQLVATVLPDNAENKTVTWSSDKPAMIDVDPATGVLTMKVTDIEADFETVTITATTAAGKTGKSEIKLKGQISKYKIIDCKAELGLLILDRNIGATEPWNKTDKNYAASNGNYYQWGKNTPVATGGDATANSNFDENWNEGSTGFLNWAVAANTPCPKGWSIPNKEQVELIADKAFNDDEYQSPAEYEVALALYNKLLVARNGKFQEAAVKYLPAAGFFWSSFTHTPVSGTNAGSLCAYAIADNTWFITNKTELVKYAMPIRCVKVAP